MDEIIEVRIRPANERDLPALEWGGEYRRYRRIYQRALQEAHKGLRVLLVAEIGEEIVGQIFIQFNANRSETGGSTSAGYLQSFRIRPAYRNRGIGTRLIQHAEDELRRRGFRRAVIAVAQDNHSARRLYERLGYSVFAEDPGKWSYIDDEGMVKYVSEPAFLMHKQI